MRYLARTQPQGMEVGVKKGIPEAVMFKLGPEDEFNWFKPFYKFTSWPQYDPSCLLWSKCPAGRTIIHLDYNPFWLYHFATNYLNSPTNDWTPICSIRTLNSRIPLWGQNSKVSLMQFSWVNSIVGSLKAESSNTMFCGPLNQPHLFLSSTHYI